MLEKEEEFTSGFVAIVGAPNSGKSTLLNKLLRRKIAMVAPKPQSTRHRIAGILTERNFQIIFWDTPGYHASERVLNKEMIARTLSAVRDSDVCLWLVDGIRRGASHELTGELVRSLLGEKKVLIAVNKADAVPRAEILELKNSLEEEFPEAVVAEVSAKTGYRLRSLKKSLAGLLEPGEALYPDDALTDQPVRVIASELVREAVFRLTEKEIPYSTAVTVDEYREAGDPARKDSAKTYIAATIHVEKENQKRIVIGKGGSKLVSIGKLAREHIERFLGEEVFLELFVRLTRDWSKNLKSVRDFGYGDKL
ncbi:MAG: GTPase Era [Deltaproteobacteria bacterium]|jgi:GTP-binding protein Era|nr:GTPase Era [Deltaproteobacteria bacterium]